jgi:hypothetical protein
MPDTEAAEKDQAESTSKTKVKKPPKKPPKKTPAKRAKGAAAHVAFPKHAISDCLRIPEAVLEQNAGKECTYREAAKFAGIGYTGQIGVEISSALKYGLFERTSPGKIKPTELVRRIVRPQNPTDKRNALREAVLKAPGISDAYTHYRGEHLSDITFLRNTAIDVLNVPADNVDEFVSVFIQSLKDAELLEDVGGKQRVLDITHSSDSTAAASSISAGEHLKKVAKGVTVQSTDTCFVMMPFAEPLGSYYTKIYEPAIRKAGLNPKRADDDIFGTGKIIDQIWAGINSARVLVAELTGRNPNVLYELGLSHAIKKPVVLVSANENDVPFDVKHVRVIYYDMTDPFWGSKLIDKVAENILSALKNPTEAVLFDK